MILDTLTLPEMVEVISQQKSITCIHIPLLWMDDLKATALLLNFDCAPYGGYA